MAAIAVIMPVYNRQERVARAIDSVLAQDFRDFELVIVDDASTDRTIEVIEGYRDPRIRLLRQPDNQLGGAARNRGIREAESELISFLDSDDEFHPDKLGYVVDYFARNPDIDVLIDSFELVFPPKMNKRNSQRINPPLQDSAAIAAGIYARHISKATPALSARRQALLAVGGFDERLRRRQDFDLVVRLTRSCRCATTDRVLWTKFWTDGAITSQAHTFIDSVLETCRRNPDYLTTPDYRVGVSRDLAHHALRLLGKGELGLLRRDLHKFSAVHGSGTTAQLLGEGMVENLKRFAMGVR